MEAGYPRFYVICSYDEMGNKYSDAGLETIGEVQNLGKGGEIPASGQSNCIMSAQQLRKNRRKWRKRFSKQTFYFPEPISMIF
jgi:hypothetical protein